MNRKSLLKVSAISFIISAITLAISYFFFHFVTDDGITLVFHEEAGKPFVANLIAQFGVMFLFFSVATLILALVCYKKNK